MINSLQQFRAGFPVEDDLWNQIILCFKRMEVPAKTILLKEGETSKKLFVVEKGCIRVWVNKQGKDKTVQFFFESSTVSSMESFKNKTPSQVYIETLEPSVLWYIHKKDLDRIISELNEIPVLRNKILDFLFERTIEYMKNFLSFIKDSPAERYLNLIKEKPQIVKRIPQHYIASYLGISTVHLSRIKNKLAKKRK